MNKNTIQTKESVFLIEKMDCPTEEKLIRNKLGKMPGIEDLRFNLMQRELTVCHTFETEQSIIAALTDIGLGPDSQEADARSCCDHEHKTPTSKLTTKISSTQLLLALSGIAAFAENQ